MPQLDSIWTRVSSKITCNTSLNSSHHRDHSLVLIMEGKKLSLQVDKMEEKSVEMDCEGKTEKKKREMDIHSDENCYQFTEIHFGAEPQTSEVRRIGMRYY